MKLEHCLTLYTKINSKWIKDLSVRLEYKTPREKHQQDTLSHKLWEYFLDPYPETKEIKAKVNKWDQIKLKNFYKATITK